MPCDPANVKVDWTLDGPVPWSAEPARRSPVVHIGGPGAFAIFGQYSLADPTRSRILLLLDLVQMNAVYEKCRGAELWTADGRLRHPSWRGIRDDLDPDDVVVEW